MLTVQASPVISLTVACVIINGIFALFLSASCNLLYLSISHSITQLFNYSVIASGVQSLRSIPVYELSNKLINQFDLSQNAGQAPFLQAFQDILLQYVRYEASDIRSFLNWWDENKSKKYVTMPENQDAIRLVTIHKSKGLEFDVVIIPFCDWSLCKSGKTLWLRPDEAPFSDMKLLPLKFDKELRNTIFIKDYQREKMLSYIDNLNLLYVAFTRARKAMFISMPQQKKDDFTDVKNLIYRVFNQPISQNDDRKYINLNEGWCSEAMRYEIAIE
jgi:ATP-dependent exoDNAse (exonuclease V) beta subunit